MSRVSSVAGPCNLAIHLRLPAWLRAHLRGRAPEFADVAARMQFVLELARLNIRHGTGGPFAAGVFTAEGRLLGPGVNLVTSAHCSLWHAEMVAIGLAQRIAGRYDLSDGGRVVCELVTSTEPCAMCLGAIPWSGVRRLVCGARDADARAIGFDEGAKPRAWAAALRARGIAVERDILRAEAAAVLRQYARGGGTIYNSGRAG
jgi:tRNA(Arg) A34 adenosine deaminase TadA